MDINFSTVQTSNTFTAEKQSFRQIIIGHFV